MQQEEPKKIEETANGSSFVSYKIYLANSDEKRRLGFKKVPNFEKFSEQLRTLFANNTNNNNNAECCQSSEDASKSEIVSDTERTNKNTFINSSLMKIKYRDEEDDLITVSTAQEWKEASIVLGSSPIKRIYVSFESDDLKQRQSQQQQQQMDETMFKCTRRGVGAHWKKEVGNRCENKKNRKLMKALMKKNTMNNDSTCEKEKKNTKEKSVQEIPIESIDALKVGSLVHLSSKASGKNLRVLPGEQNGKIDFLGGTGNWATFLVHRGVQNPNAVRFQNVANPNFWLRISKKGELNAFGKGGPLTEFVLVAPRLKKNKKDNKQANANMSNCLEQQEFHKMPYGEQQQQQPQQEQQPYQCSPMFVCLRAVTMGLHVGSLPNGTIKDPKKVGTGKCAQFLILPKLKEEFN